jgi:tetratricopeptide (TPR) repeat protein
MGLYKEAIENFTKAVALDTGHYESYFGRGNCYYQLEDFNKALRDYDKAVELFRENSELWYAKADAEYNLGRVKESIKSYKIVVSLNPENHQASLDLANTLIEAGRFTEADETLTKLIELKTAWAEPYYSKSKLYFLQAEIELGVKYLEMAFTINPEDRFEFDFEKEWERVLQFLISRDN